MNAIFINIDELFNDNNQEYHESTLINLIFLCHIIDITLVFSPIFNSYKSTLYYALFKHNISYQINYCYPSVTNRYNETNELSIMEFIEDNKVNNYVILDAEVNKYCKLNNSVISLTNKGIDDKIINEIVKVIM